MADYQSVFFVNNPIRMPNLIWSKVWHTTGVWDSDGQCILISRKGKPGWEPRVRIPHFCYTRSRTCYGPLVSSIQTTGWSIHAYSAEISVRKILSCFSIWTDHIYRDRIRCHAHRYRDSECISSHTAKHIRRDRYFYIYKTDCVGT